MAQPEPPGLKLAAPLTLLHASPTTPAKPMARPAMRSRVSRSFNQSQAMKAPNSGAVALKIDDRPAVIDSSA